LFIRLTQLVAYLPAPVIGGYLAFIGYFCLLAGLNLTTGVVFTGKFPADIASGAYAEVFLSAKNLSLWAPAVFGGLTLLLVGQRAKHFLALPATIIAIPVLFYLVLAAGGYSLEEARLARWLHPLDSPPAFWHVFELFKFSQVHWEVLPGLLPTWGGMVIVVAFASCLDVAAVEMDMGARLRVHKELITVGSAVVTLVTLLLHLSHSCYPCHTVATRLVHYCYTVVAGGFVQPRLRTVRRLHRLLHLLSGEAI
jgi:SulP family sulfate permease